MTRRIGLLAAVAAVALAYSAGPGNAQSSSAMPQQGGSIYSAPPPPVSGAIGSEGATGPAAPQAGSGTYALPPAATMNQMPRSPDTLATPAMRQKGNNCDPGERIDGSTAADAKRKLEAAGITNVSGLKKGCDNVWHAKGMHQGQLVGVALSPQGQIIGETD